MAFIPTDLCLPHKPAGKEMGFQNTVEQNALGADMAEAGMWLWEVQEAEFTKHSHNHSLTGLCCPRRQEKT